MKNVLVTGATGSFGKAFINRLLNNFTDIERIVVFSRDELKQFDISQTPPFRDNPKVRFFLGDIRDQKRIRFALDGIDTVIHAAALKQVGAAEYNPFEFIKTNILGAQNLIEAVLDSQVSNVVALSTDKAASPINLYGATKLASDKLFVSANGIKGKRDLRFSVVRYGNVFGSRGSVVPLFLKFKNEGFLPITHPEMTRFNITLNEGVDMVLWALNNAAGGEIFVPKIPSYYVSDLAAVICPNCEKRVVGIRPGEKIHEELITSSDSRSTLDLGDYFAILPPVYNQQDIENYAEKSGGCAVQFVNGFTSDKNPVFLTRDQLKELVYEFQSQVFNEGRLISYLHARDPVF